MKRQYVIIYESDTHEGPRIGYSFPGSLSEIEDKLHEILFPGPGETDNKIIFVGQIKREFDFMTAIKITEKK